MDSVVHFEIPAEDTKRAQKFYKDSFGWKMDSVPGIEYTMLHTGETDSNNMPVKTGFINGGMMKKSNEITNPVLTIGVEDIDEALDRITKNGGAILINKMKVSEFGYSAYIKDTENNTIGLWQSLIPQ